MIEKLKSKVTNPYLKDNFTVESIANFFANFISGNNFMNNLEVKEISMMNKAEIRDSLKVKNEAKIENLNVSNLNNKVLSISDNEITFDPEAILKMKGSRIAFKMKDVFEVITFMKFIVKICGSKLEKCDFNNLLKNYNSNQLLQLMNTYEKKRESSAEKVADNNKDPNKSNLRKMNFKQMKDEKKVEKKAEEEHKDSIDTLDFDLSKDPSFLQKNSLNDEYYKMMENPVMGGLLDSYYYDTGIMNNNIMGDRQY